MSVSQITVALAKARVDLLTSGASGAFHGALAMSLIPVIRDDIETAATDAKHFYYNATWFDSLSERERVGVLVHEIRHCIALHHCRRNGRDLDKFNIAADYALNPGIIADGFKLPADVLIDAQYAGLSAEEIYRLREVSEQTAQDEAEQAETDKQESEDSSDNDSSDSRGDDSDDSSESGQDESNNDQEDAEGDNDQSGNESDDTNNDSNDGNGQGDGKQGDESSQGSGNAENDHLYDPSEFSANIPGPSQELTAEDFENMATEAQDKSDRRGRTISDPGACGGIMDAAPTSDPAAMAQAEADMQQRIRQAIAVARKANGGTLPEDLARLVGELSAPKLDARDILRRFIDRSIQKSFQWTRPNKRYLSHGLVLPSLVSDRPGHIVALVDVSGSLWSESAQAALTSELQGALDNGAADQITIVYADTDVTGSHEYFPGDQIAMEGNGGGGTDFRAPLQWVADNCEDVAAILYLTDLQTCDYGAEPDSPLLWLVYGDPREAKYWIDRAPFGEAVYLDE